MSIQRTNTRIQQSVRSALPCCALLWSLAAGLVPVSAANAADSVAAPAADDLDVIVVTSRKRAENVQDVPIALSVLSGAELARQGTYTIQQVSQQAPTLQFISSNPRNITLTVRGLGQSFGLANDAWNKVWASIR